MVHVTVAVWLLCAALGRVCASRVWPLPDCAAMCYPRLSCPALLSFEPSELLPPEVHMSWHGSYSPGAASVTPALHVPTVTPSGCWWETAALSWESLTLSPLAGL